ncbi:MAG: ferrous iron transport protein B, partial [Proteobacteria bacterium]|nr:ferrous iron transport protein B [Pseudomonadota bacterium]
MNFFAHSQPRLTNDDVTTELESTELVQVALAGNPNSGKTTLFNALTGARQHVGNYPGVTVEKRSGATDVEGRQAEIADLPGTYSLTSFSPEERVVQDELLDGDFDVVVVVVDSTTLHRSLVLLTQVMLIGANPVLCLNMADEARAAGQRLDLEAMAMLLGFPVVETVGHRGEGVGELRQAIARAIAHPVARAADRLVLGDSLDRALKVLVKALVESKISASRRPWIAAKLLLDERHFVEQVEKDPGGALAVNLAADMRRRIEGDTGQDMPLYFTQQLFGFVDGLLREVTLQAPTVDTRAMSDAIDKVLVHRWLGLPIFAGVMYGIFWLTFTLGEPPMGWIEAAFDLLAHGATRLWPAGSESPLQSLLVDGVIAGVGGVVVFLPNIVLLFMGLALLEDTGYMARVAFLMDRVMHRFGLHGKSFVPMMTGFGCTIPGIMATRTLENERDRLTTMLVLPLMSCGARLPIWMLLIPAFFAPPWRAPMLFFIYSVGIALAFLLALALRKSLLAGEEAPFVMELPPYRLPTAQAVLTKMSERSWVYLRKAGTVILAISVLMWFITAYPNKGVYEVDLAVASGEVALTEKELKDERRAEDMRYSIAGRIGRAIEPVISPLGFDWRMGTA